MKSEKLIGKLSDSLSHTSVREIVGLIENPNDRIRTASELASYSFGQGDFENGQRYMNIIVEANEAAVELADRDSLTGIMKRETFEKGFDTAYSMFDRSDVPFAVMMADVDNFKDVNDDYGHWAGDTVLKEVAARLGQGMRKVDGIYRYAGDEFAGIYSGVNNTHAIFAANNSVARVSASGVDVGDGKILTPTISAGVYVVRKGDNFKDAVGKADEALYRAKANGRDRASL